MKTTHIEIVRYRRTLVTGNPEPGDEDDRLTIDLTPEQADLDAARPETFAVIVPHTSALISRLRDFLTRRRE